MIKNSVIASVLCMYSLAALAQQHVHTESADETPTPQNTMSGMDSMQGMDHSKMQQNNVEKADMSKDKSAMSGMDAMQGMEHSKMQQKDAAEADMPMDKDTMSGMDSVQGVDMSKTPPLDARDPHAYSDGLTLDSGAFALPGPRQLKMADEHAFWAVTFNRFEYADGLSSSVGSVSQYDAQAWYGNSYERLVIKAEGELTDNKLAESETQILWGHAFSTFWDSQIGLRFDSSEGPSRQWLTLGVQGLAPYWFEVDTSLSVGPEGRTAFNLEAEYELLITQRLILQPRFIVSAFGKDDSENGVGKGLSLLTTGIRLRYEFSRQFAPYLGVEWTGKYGNTADFAKLEGRATRQTQWVAGIRFWF
ncbi:MAG: copper resistance protein B [Alteromonadaceae bacterium]|uniref:Copper resistance protein B n=3 Tax=Alteromonadaceae TaxID=72275 RepID=K6YJB4_9ALTE|nr:copper resistance protein B [Alteromonadaceae bacterium]GAC03055.1 copper resistance protein B [Paraglaciecola agarilytica NO2]GAC24091.1 copper resistance protein B [Paraglaciecola mesophila KMM 241]